MKTLFLSTVLFFLLIGSKGYSQTVYVNQSGGLYHTKACKLYTPAFEAVPLWRAKGSYGKKPCPKCKPPTKEGKVGAKKKSAAKPKAKPAPKK